MNANKFIPYRVREISDLERLADRMHAYGIAESLEAQLEMTTELDQDKCRHVVLKVCGELYKMLEQATCLEQKMDAMQTSLDTERKHSLDREVSNRDLKSRNATLAKENRNLKRSLDKMMSES